MRWLFLFILFMMFSVDFVSAEEKIDINSAPLADLVKIIHVGEARALELISLRPFSSLDDLMKIKGIGQSRLADIKNQGLARVVVTGTENSKPAEDDGPPQFSPAADTDEPVEVRLLRTEKAEISLAKGLPMKSPIALAAAVFTSLFSGGIILILKKHVRT